MKSASLLATSLFAVPTAVTAATTLIGGSIRNGDFNADTSTTDARLFSDTPDWINLAGNAANQATRTNLPIDGTRNAVLTQDDQRLFGSATAYTAIAGDVFDLSYDWRDAASWQPATDQIRVRLFTTADNTITGSQTTLVEDFSGLNATVGTWESVDHNAFYTATAADAGKQIFVELTAVNGTPHVTQAGQFARLDNFVLEVTSIPEPSSLAACGLLGILAFRRRK